MVWEEINHKAGRIFLEYQCLKSILKIRFLQKWASFFFLIRVIALDRVLPSTKIKINEKSRIWKLVGSLD